MKQIFTSLILFFAAFYGNCLKRTYEIQAFLIDGGKRQPVTDYSKNYLEIDNIQAYSPLEINLRSQSTRLVEYNAQGCHNCVILLEFIPNDQTHDRKLYTSIKADLIAGKNIEDFLEVFISESNDVVGIKYGINRVLASGEIPNPTIIKDMTVNPPVETPDIIGDIPTTTFTKKGEEGAPEPKEEQSFFKKYMWWFIIGGFVIFQFMNIDKEKLAEAANQAQNPQGGRR